jgi:hypothetical protein
VSLPGEGGQHLGRVPGQQDVREPAEKPPVETFEVVGHVLEEVDGALARPEQHLPDHPLAVGVHGRQHLVVAGMLGPCDLEVVAVERLVHDHGVGPLPERVHKSRRDVARPRPYAELQAVLHV